MVEETDGDWALSAPIWIENTDSGTFTADMAMSTDTDPCTINNTSGAAINNATIAFYNGSSSTANLISSNTYAIITSGVAVNLTMDNASWTPGTSGTNTIYAVYTDSTTTIIKRCVITDLMITEVVANSPNASSTGDDYEFIEVFNNTENDIDLSGYKISYHYSCGGDTTDYTDYDISTSFIVPARSKVLLWMGISTEYDYVDDFLSAYGLGLNDENRVKVYKLSVSHLGNINGASLIYLMTDAGKVISRAWYNVGTQLNLDADSNPESIRYEYSNDGDITMDYTDTSTMCNPFVVSTGTGNQVIKVYFTVVYNANGGTGTQMENTIVSRSVHTALRSNTFTRSGYSFGGWYAYRAYDNKYRGYAQGSSVNEWLPAEEIATYNVYYDGCEVWHTAPCGKVTMCAIWIPN